MEIPWRLAKSVGLASPHLVTETRLLNYTVCMEIYWLGHGCFRLRGKEATVLTDPCAPTTGYKIWLVE